VSRRSLSREELADRAGVGAEYVDRLVQLRILTPGDGDRFSMGDLRGARLIHSLDRAGIPLDGIAAAVRSGHLSFAFFDLPNYERFSAISSKTFREVSAETSIPLEVLLGVREAAGSTRAEPEDRMRDDELEIVPMIRLQVSHGFDPAVIERTMRMYGDSLRRIAETEADCYHTQVEQPLFDAGKGPGEVLEIGSRFGADWNLLADPALLAMYHSQQEHAWMRNIVEDVESALEQAGLRSRLATPPAVSFLDLSGYTRLTEERGDKAAADLASTLAGLVNRASGDHGGRAVKWLGDGVMFVFKDPGRAVLGALEMVERIPAAGLPPARVGVDAGPVIFQDGDYFGRTVNTAARIAAYARSGEVLVSDAVLQAAHVAGCRFEPIGPAELKGVAQPLSLHLAKRES